MAVINSALLHFNGDDASTTFTDESGKTWTASGNAQLDTAQKVFGTASALFDGVNDYISTPNSADFNFPGDFTIDFRMRPVAVNVSDSIMGNGYISGWSVFVATTKLEFWAANAARCSFTHGMSAGTWAHIAIVRIGTPITIYVNGTSIGSSNYATGITSANSLFVGNDADDLTNDYNGHIDELRILNGIGMWNGNFTPSSSEYSLYVPPSSGKQIALLSDYGIL